MTEPAGLESDKQSAKKSESLDSSLVTLEDFKGVSIDRQAGERKVAVDELSADIDEGNKLTPDLKFLEQSRELGAFFLKADLAAISDFVKNHAADPRMPAIVNELSSHFREYKIEARWIPQTRHLAFYESGMPTTQKPAQEALIFSADGKVSARQRAVDGTAVPNGKNNQETLHGLSRQVVDGLVQRKQQTDTLLQTIKLNADLIQPKTDRDKQNLAVAQRLAESLSRGRLADMVPVFQRQINPADLPAIAENLEALTKDMGLITQLENKGNALFVGHPRGMGDGYLCQLPCSTTVPPLAARLNAGTGGESELRSLLYRPDEHFQNPETLVVFRDAARAISGHMARYYYRQFY